MHIKQFKVQNSKFKGKVIKQFKVQNSKFKGKVIIQFKVQNSKFKGKVNEGFSNYCERRYGQHHPAL